MEQIINYRIYEQGHYIGTKQVWLKEVRTLEAAGLTLIREDKTA